MKKKKKEDEKKRSQRYKERNERINNVFLSFAG